MDRYSRLTRYFATKFCLDKIRFAKNYQPCCFQNVGFSFWVLITNIDKGGLDIVCLFFGLFVCLFACFSSYICSILYLAIQKR